MHHLPVGVDLAGDLRRVPPGHAVQRHGGGAGLLEGDGLVAADVEALPVHRRAVAGLVDDGGMVGAVVMVAAPATTWPPVGRRRGRRAGPGRAAPQRPLQPPCCTAARRVRRQPVASDGRRACLAPGVPFRPLSYQNRAKTRQYSASAFSGLTTPCVPTGTRVLRMSPSMSNSVKRVSVEAAADALGRQPRVRVALLVLPGLPAIVEGVELGGDRHRVAEGREVDPGGFSCSSNDQASALSPVTSPE